MHPSMCIKTPKCHAVEVQRSKRKNSRRNRWSWPFSRRDRNPCPRRTPPSLQEHISTIHPLGSRSSSQNVPSSLASSAGASAAAAAPPAAAPGAAAAPPPEPTLTRRSLMSLPSRACVSEKNHNSSATNSHFSRFLEIRLRRAYSVMGGCLSEIRTLAKIDVQMGSTSTLAAAIRVWSLSAYMVVKIVA